MDNTERYLSLLKKSLLNDLYVENEARLLYVSKEIALDRPVDPALFRHIKQHFPDMFAHILLCKAEGACWYFVRERDASGIERMLDLRNACDTAHSMIGTQRMDHLHRCLDVIREQNIPGDVIETGVCRGGAVIFMAGYLAAHGMNDRLVWGADSFEGLPKPVHPHDAGYDLSAEKYPALAVSLDEVQELFRRYDLLNSQIHFLKGWFADTLPGAPIERLALLRLDGDLYASTMDSLHALYHKVVPGGFVIVDDYDAVPPCRRAVHDFRGRLSIAPPLQRIDNSSVFWRKGEEA